jgi:hypothetical protein
MKLTSTFIFVLLFGATLSAQSEVYSSHITQAEAFYNKGAYAAAAGAYSEAFRSFGWKGYKQDRYNAAKAWAQAGTPDSAFFNLIRLAEKMSYDNLQELNSEPAFNSLKPLPQWQKLNEMVRANQPTMPELADELNNIRRLDQQYRMMIDSVESKSGRNSAEMNALWNSIHVTDSVNTARVTEILDTHGWLGRKEIGGAGNSALFLVIQHADLKVQEKYLPMMREAVKAGNADGSSLALLEDRVLMRNGKKQIYGSQVRRDPETGKSYFYAIEDVDRVDELRASVGLGPLAEYGEHFGIYWGPEAKEKNRQMKVGQ